MTDKTERSLKVIVILAGVSIFIAVLLLIFILPLGMLAGFETLGVPSTLLSAEERLILGTYLALNAAAIDKPAGDIDIVATIEVEEGLIASGVVENLVDLGIVADGTLLIRYLRYRGLDTGIEAGTYLLSGAMTPRQIGDALQTARPGEIVFTILEGWRLEQIADAIDVSGFGFSSGEFVEAVRVPVDFSTLPPFAASAPTLEGFLFPDTYILDANIDAEQLILKLLENFDGNVSSGLIGGFEARGLDLSQAVILASIVEREAVVGDERPLIASVFLNRLAIGSKLDADPTVQYALGQQAGGGWWKSPLSFEDLEFNSPYNTYIYSGLPPGPIANPGLSSLEAVANAPTTPFFYFRATCDNSGRHLFAETFQEHIDNACP